ncbi:YqhG family protein [Peribacillus kribbensis]|uniref:YqhG family protein n=1 Tax=Peribacillus kribbensis TaxID=356658 RepID=UPI00041C3DC8|nr:YqhG family protein [Peribacillus kribbensis]
MQQAEIHNYLQRYFQSNDCQILEDKPGYFMVHLTIDQDKLLMNRPFYWHYLEKTGGEPNPAKLTIITDPDRAPDDIKGEFIHFGSPRLRQIFEANKQLASYIRLFEDKSAGMTQNPLYPWLGLNVKVSFQCNRKKDVFLSLGLNLISGQIQEEFHDKVTALNVTPKIPDYSFTLSPLIMPKSGMLRLDRHIRSSLAFEDHTWAEEAYTRWQNDLQLLETFYEDQEKGESYETEKEALREQYEPRISIRVINGGLFYLSETAI